MNPIKSIFDVMVSLDPREVIVPDMVGETFSIYPETVLACLDYFEGIINDDLIKSKQSQLSLLFNEAFTCLRYKVDNQDVCAQTILERLHDRLKQDFQVMSMEKQLIITRALHDSKLPTPELDYGLNAIDPAVLKKIPDIAPQLPALLDQMRRDGGLNTSFELYDFLISQIQMQLFAIQCALINEIVTAKNTFIQDVGVFMMLHPKKAIRQMVPLIWMDNFAKNATKVSPVQIFPLTLVNTPQSWRKVKIRPMQPVGETKSHFQPESSCIHFVQN